MGHCKGCEMFTVRALSQPVCPGCGCDDTISKIVVALQRCLTAMENRERAGLVKEPWEIVNLQEARKALDKAYSMISKDMVSKTEAAIARAEVR
jgi:hypothetical protein